MDEVRAYHQSEPDAKQSALGRWHAELGERIVWLSLARKYIEGLMQGRKEEVNLQVVEPERAVWFVHEGPIGCFEEHYARRIKELQAASIPFSDSYFRWMADLQPGWVRGHVGFRLSSRSVRLDNLPAGGELEERPSSLMLSLEHRDDIKQIRETYRRLFAFMQEQGWEAAGEAIERYPAGPPECYVEVLIPILHLER